MNLEGVHFQEREVNSMVDWLLRIVYEESMLSYIGSACLIILDIYLEEEYNC